MPESTYLHDVILGHGADDPGLVGVPGEVGDLGGVSPVDEQQLGGTVFCVFRRLLLAYLRQVPHVKPTTMSIHYQILIQEIVFDELIYQFQGINVICIMDITLLNWKKLSPFTLSSIASYSS